MPRRRSRSRTRSRSRSISSSRSRSRSASRPDRSYSRSASAAPPKGDKTGHALKWIGVIAATAAVAHWAWPRGVINGEDMDWKGEIERMRAEKRRAGRAIAAGGHAIEAGGRAVRQEWDREREGRHAETDLERDRIEWERYDRERERWERDRERWEMMRRREDKMERRRLDDERRPQQIAWDPERERDRDARAVLGRPEKERPQEKDLEMVWDGRGRGMVIEPDGSSRPLRDREVDMLMRHELERRERVPVPRVEEDYPSRGRVPAPQRVEEDYPPRGRSRTRTADRLNPSVDEKDKERGPPQADPLGIYDGRPGREREKYIGRERDMGRERERDMGREMERERDWEREHEREYFVRGGQYDRARDWVRERGAHPDDRRRHDER